MYLRPVSVSVQHSLTRQQYCMGRNTRCQCLRGDGGSKGRAEGPDGECITHSAPMGSTVLPDGRSLWHGSITGSVPSGGDCPLGITRSPATQCMRSVSIPVRSRCAVKWNSLNKMCGRRAYAVLRQFELGPVSSTGLTRADLLCSDKVPPSVTATMPLPGAT